MKNFIDFYQIFSIKKCFFLKCMKMLSAKWQTLCASLYWLEFNSLGSSDAIWRQRYGCLTAPSHYLNQCWLIISKIQLHSSDGNFTRDTHQSSVTLSKMSLKSPRGQWVKMKLGRTYDVTMTPRFELPDILWHTGFTGFQSDLFLLDAWNLLWINIWKDVQLYDKMSENSYIFIS